MSDNETKCPTKLRKYPTLCADLFRKLFYTMEIPCSDLIKAHHPFNSKQRSTCVNNWHMLFVGMYCFLI